MAEVLKLAVNVPAECPREIQDGCRQIGELQVAAERGQIDMGDQIRGVELFIANNLLHFGLLREALCPLLNRECKLFSSTVTQVSHLAYQDKVWRKNTIMREEEKDEINY